MKKFTESIKLALIAPIISAMCAARVIRHDIPAMWREHKIGIVFLTVIAPIVFAAQLVWIAILPVACLLSRRVRESVVLARAMMMQPIA